MRHADRFCQNLPEYTADLRPNNGYACDWFMYTDLYRTIPFVSVTCRMSRVLVVFCIERACVKSYRPYYISESSLTVNTLSRIYNHRLSYKPILLTVITTNLCQLWHLITAKITNFLTTMIYLLYYPQQGDELN